MSRISPEYQKLQEQFHIQRADYGLSSIKHVEPIMALAKALGTTDILDYGCGKAMLQKGLPYPIQNYDPCMPEYATRPVPADLVVCTDVLEHIELDCLPDVLADLAALTKQYLFIDVATVPASKILPDGRNAHILLEPPNWWVSCFLNSMNLHSFQVQKSGFTAIFSKPQPQPESPDA